MTRAASPLSAASVTAGLRRLRPYWWALGILALVLAGALFARDPLVDAVTLVPSVDASLRRPVGYVALAPLSNVLDTLTLLSLRQHIALVVTLLLGWSVWWWRRGRIVPGTVAPTRRRVRQAARIGLSVLGLVGAYAAATVLPRPMAAIDVGPQLVVVDFHSHTRESHDGRSDWTAEDVRAWHRAAGFDVAYITDHRSFDGAREGWANNPGVASEATVLLPAIEVVWKGEHVNLLDADRVFRGVLTPSLRDVDEEALRLASTIPGREPMVIETLPGNLDNVTWAHGPGTAGVRAVEIVDGAPKGLGQTRRERARIIALADSLNLALVAGSNHHGWGHTAAGWTLLLLPQWRALGPEQLSTAIGAAIANGGRSSTSVVQRYLPDTDSGLMLPFTAPLVAWAMFRTMSVDERVMWITWTAVVLLLLWLRARRAPGPTD